MVLIRRKNSIEIWIETKKRWKFLKVNSQTIASSKTNAREFVVHYNINNKARWNSTKKCSVLVEERGRKRRTNGATWKFRCKYFWSRFSHSVNDIRGFTWKCVFPSLWLRAEQSKRETEEERKECSSRFQALKIRSKMI